MVRGLKFCIQEVEGLYYPCSENKGVISFAVTVKLICVFVFAYAKSRFSHDEAQLISAFNGLFIIYFEKVKKVHNFKKNYL